MKKSVRLLLCLMIATAVFSMQLFSVCAADNSGENDTEVRISLLGKYDSADTASVKQVNTYSKTIQFRNHDTGKNYTLKYDNTSQIYDIHREPVSASLLEVGQVVDITFLKGTKHLNSLVVSDDAWVEAGVTDFDLVSNDETAKIKGTVYHLTRRTLIISDGEAVNPEDILATDTLRVSGVDKEIYSIVVTRGHGYVSLSSDKVNDRSLVGAWIELDKEVIRRITPNMLISAPEGSYNVSIAGNGTKFSSEIVVNRNEETVIDTGFVEVEAVKKGDVTFVVTPENARLFVDGEETLTDIPHTYTYGKHKIHVMADGYVSQDHYLKVAEADATIFIELEKDPDASESSSEEDSSDSSDSAESIDSSDSSSEASYVVPSNSEVPSSASTASTSAPDLFSSAANSSRSSNSSTNATVDTAAASTTVSAESSTESSTDSSASSTTSASDDTDSSDTSDTSSTDDTSGTSDTSDNSGSSDTSGSSGNSGSSDTSGSSGNSGSSDDSGSSDTSDESDSSDDNIVSGYMVTFDAPIGAEVYLDDNYVGIMPVSFAKPAGQHMVTLQKTGYETKSYTIYIDSEKTNVTYTFPEMIPDRRQDSSDDGDSGNTSDSGDSGSSSDSGDSGSKPDSEDSGSSSDGGNSGSSSEGGNSGSASDDSGNSGSKPDSGDSGSSSESGKSGSSVDGGNSGSKPDSGDSGSSSEGGKTGSSVDGGNSGSKPDSGNSGSTSESGKTGSSTDGSNSGSKPYSGNSGSTSDSGKTGSSTDGGNSGSKPDSGDSGSASESRNTGSTSHSGDSGSKSDGSDSANSSHSGDAGSSLNGGSSMNSTDSGTTGISSDSTNAGNTESP